MRTETNEIKILFRQLDYLIDKLNESEAINEGKLLDSIKNRIKYFIQKNKENALEKLPIILDYIKGKHLPKNYITGIVIFISSLLMSSGYTEAEIKKVIQKSDLNTEYDTNISVDDINFDYNGLNFSFEVGEYTISEKTKQNIYNKIKSQLGKYSKYVKGKYLNGEFIVTISQDPSNPDKSNFANDDTDEDKEYGGTLLYKRMKSAEEFIKELQKMFNQEFTDLTVNVEVKGDGYSEKREGYFNFIQISTEVSYKDKTYDETKANLITSDQKYLDKNVGTKPNIISGGKDISGLSRNYQFVELLKLGGIDAKRFNGDKIQDGDEYSEWIVDTRKHIKKFMFKLQKTYPEFNIYYDKTSIAKSPISGARAGMSNVDQQYTFVEEKHILRFDSFLYENAADDNTKEFNDWNYILGNKFPHLTEQQAVKFDNNIAIFLNYLEQMYYHSSLKFEVIKDDQETEE